MRLITTLVVLAGCISAQQSPPASPPSQRTGPNHQMDAAMKAIDDVAWHLKLGDIAVIDNVAGIR
jgi:hypothetical protein